MFLLSLLVSLNANLLICQTALKALLINDGFWGIYKTQYDISPLYLTSQANDDDADINTTGVVLSDMGNIILALRYDEGKISKHTKRRLNNTILNKHAPSFLGLHILLSESGNKNTITGLSNMYTAINHYIDKNTSAIMDLSNKIKLKKRIPPAIISEYLDTELFFTDSDFSHTLDYNLAFLTSRFKLLDNLRTERIQINQNITRIHELGHALAAMQLYQDSRLYLGNIWTDEEGNEGSYNPKFSYPTTFNDIKFMTNRHTLKEFNKVLDFLPPATSTTKKLSILIDRNMINNNSVHNIIARILLLMAGPNTYSAINLYLSNNQYNKFLQKLATMESFTHDNRYDPEFNDEYDLPLTVLNYFILLKQTNPELFSKLIERDIEALDNAISRIAYDVALLYHYSNSLIPPAILRIADIVKNTKTKSNIYQITQKRADIFKKMISPPAFLNTDYWNNFFHDKPYDLNKYYKLLTVYPDLSNYIDNFIHSLYILVATESIDY